MDDDGAMVRREQPESTVDRIAGDELAARVRGRPVVVRQQPDVRFVATAPPRLVAACVDEQAAQPGIEPFRIAQRAKIPPRSHERLLHRVLGATAIAQDESGSREQPVQPRNRKCGEGVAVTAGRLANQCLIFHRASCAHLGYGVRLHGMAHRRRDRFSPGVGYDPPMTADTDVRIRPGTLEDNFACAAVLADAINDLGHRHGSIDEGSAIDLGVQWPHWRRFMEHITRSAAEFWVAEAADGELIGYARSIDRDGVFELTEFFVRPGVQSRGVGRDLLQRAFPRGRGHLRVIIATTDIRAVSRYLRAGVVPRFPIVTFTGPAREVAPLPGLDVEPLDLDRDLDAVHAIDDEVLGHRRELDHRWFAEEREGYRYLRDGRVVGYGYVALPQRGGNGPFAVLDQTDLAAVMTHAERRRHELGAPEAFFEVALHNRVAIDHLLGRGYRMDAFMTLLCSSEPFGRFEQYLFCAPGLIL